VYSSLAQPFPLDIKISLVPKFSAMPKSNTPERACMLMDHQAWFLLHSATSKLSLDSHSNLTTSQVMNLLHSTSCTSLLDNKTVTPLFHVVSPMVRSKGCLIWYLPQNCLAVIETLAQFQTFLPGFQAPPDNHLLSSISSQHAGGEDPILCLSSQHTTGKVHARKGPIWDGSMPSTTELAW